MLTKSLLRQMWPKAPAAKIAAIAAVAPEVLAEAEITTPLRLAHFMAQVSHENGAGRVGRESLTYTTFEVLQRTFGKGHHSAALTDDEVRSLLRQPERLAERVYGLGNPKKAKELGNRDPGDGYRCRGGGDLQATGRKAYEWLTKITGVDLVADPDKITDPAIAFRTAALEFKALKCLPAADADDVNLVTRRVNGGRNGLAERTVWLKRWKEALPDFDEQEDDPRPRFAEAPPPKSILKSTIANAQVVQGGIAAGAATVAVTKEALQVDEPARDALTEAIKTIAEKGPDMADRVGTIVETGRTIADAAPPAIGFAKVALGFLTDPFVVAAVAVVAVVFAVVAFRERRRHLREDGI